jgi:hypothetical protein
LSALPTYSSRSFIVHSDECPFLDADRDPKNGWHAAEAGNDVAGKLGIDHFAEIAQGLDECATARRPRETAGSSRRP